MQLDTKKSWLFYRLNLIDADYKISHIRIYFLAMTVEQIKLYYEKWRNDPNCRILRSREIRQAWLTLGQVFMGSELVNPGFWR